MLEYNTMRFGTDVFSVEEPLQVAARIGGKNVPLLCRTDQLSNPSLAFKYQDETYYLCLTDTSSSLASGVRVCVDGTTYAIAKDNVELHTIEDSYLVSYLKFDESTTKDECGNTWTAYDTTSIDGTNAINGQALQLNKGYLRSNSPVEFGGADFTVDFYGYMNSSSEGYAGFFCAQSTTNTGGNSRPGQISLYRNSSSAQLHIETYNSSGGTQTANVNISSDDLTNARHHFELDYSHANSTLKIFVDGSLTLTCSITIERLARYIFLGTNSYTPSSMRMVGTIDEFRLYDGVALHTENFTPPTPMSSYLVSYLKFDESPTKDECGNTWTAVGSPTIGTTGAISGNALQLNGSSCIKRNSTFAFTGQPFTISCHFKSANYSGYGTPCFFQLYVDTNKRFQVNANTQGYCIRLALISGGSLVMYGDSTSYSSKNYFDGNIHHCEMVHENSRWYLFLDGVCVYSGTYSFPTGNYNLAIGYNGSDTNNLLTGQIDEFQIYDGIALHTSDFTPPTAADYS